MLRQVRILPKVKTMEIKLIKQRRFRRRSINHRSGQITLIMAAITTALFGFAALAIDLGYIALTKSQIKNAADALKESGVIPAIITVRTRLLDDNRVRMEVADNGVGISEENLTRIFAHGFTTKREGHGFGLHSGALAAKELGGSLVAESDGTGKGSTFILELPYSEHQEA